MPTFDGAQIDYDDNKEKLVGRHVIDCWLSYRLADMTGCGL